MKGRKQTRSKEYVGGGAVLVVKNNRKEYIVLVKRSDDAKHNPGAHSAFFGWAEKGDANNPVLVASRELNEELLLVNRRRNTAYSLLLPGSENLHDAAKIAEEGIRLWQKEKGVILPRRIEPLPVKILKTMEYIEDIGRIKGFVVRADIKNSLGRIDFFDGETKHENPRSALLDRRIDLFELQTFRRWWLEGKIGRPIKATASFRGGIKIKPCRLIRAQDNLSPSFIFALNAWWGN